jgi:hypothetical protein
MTTAFPKYPVRWMRVAMSVVFMAFFSVGPVSAQLRMTKEEALRQYFPDASVERRTAFLTDTQVASVQAKGRAKVPSKVLTYYVARKDEQIVGTSFFETRIVRTMPATFVVVINPDTTIRLVEILAFHEPTDYVPPDRWLEQFHGTSPDDDLFLKRGIQNISGATMTAYTLTDGVRRLLASYEEVVAKEMVSK